MKYVVTLCVLSIVHDNTLNRFSCTGNVLLLFQEYGFLPR